MENINSVERRRESGLAKELAKLILIPGYLVKYLRDSEKERANALDSTMNINKVERTIGYASAVGVGVCHAGFYYTQFIEPLYKLLAN